MKSNLIIQNLVLFVVPQKSSKQRRRARLVSLHQVRFIATLGTVVTEGGRKGGTNDKQITLGRTWPGGHVLYCVGSRLTEIENRNRNQQK